MSLKTVLSNLISFADGVQMVICESRKQKASKGGLVKGWFLRKQPQINSLFKLNKKSPWLNTEELKREIATASPFGALFHSREV